MWNVVVLVLFLLSSKASGDCFTTAVRSTADCFQAITCDAPSTITIQMDACRKAFNSGIVKSGCSEQATITPASIIAVVKALIVSSEANECTAGVKFPAEEIATALRQQIATVDAKEAAAGVSDDDLVLTKKKKAAESPLLITADDNQESTGKSTKQSPQNALTSTKETAEISSAIKSSIQDGDQEDSGETTRSVGSKPGFGSFLKKVGGVVGGVAGGVAGGITRSNPLLNAAGGVLAQKRATTPAPAKPSSGPSDDSAAAAVANAGAAVASAGAAIAKTSADEHDEKDVSKDKKGHDSDTKTPEIVAVEHNGKLAKIVEVGDEKSLAPKTKIVNVEDDDHEVGEKAPKTSKRHVSEDDDDDRRSSPRPKTVASGDPSVIVDSRGRFSIPDDELVKPKLPSEKGAVSGRTEQVTEIKTTTKSVSGSNSGDEISTKSAPSVVNNGTTEKSSKSAPSVVNNEPVAVTSTINWLLIGLLAGAAIIVLIVIFIAIRRISAAA